MVVNGFNGESLDVDDTSKGHSEKRYQHGGNDWARARWKREKRHAIVRYDAETQKGVRVFKWNHLIESINGILQYRAETAGEKKTRTNQFGLPISRGELEFSSGWGKPKRNGPVGYSCNNCEIRRHLLLLHHHRCSPCVARCIHD